MQADTSTLVEWSRYGTRQCTRLTWSYPWQRLKQSFGTRVSHKKRVVDLKCCFSLWSYVETPHIVWNHFWEFFHTNFDPDQPCTYHICCPCSACHLTQPYHPANILHSIVFYLLLHSFFHSCTIVWCQSVFMASLFLDFLHLCTSIFPFVYYVILKSPKKYFFKYPSTCPGPEPLGSRTQD